jgi:cytochrome c-type biogenesis protein CcmH/NrfF
MRNQTFKKIKIAGALILGLALAVGGSLWLVRAQESDSRVNQIAWKFRCICEMNYGGKSCTLAVAPCHCGEAEKRKAYIRSLLKEGKSDADIMLLFNQKYGNLIGS